MAMNDSNFARRGSDTAPSGGAEELFASLLEQFDVASAEGATPSAEPGETLPANLRGELLDLQECLTLLNQAAREGVLGLFDATAELWGRDSTGGNAREDRSFVGERIGRFELVRELGRGGYGIVFLARDADMARDVALKLPRPEALVAPELRRRFIREAQAAGRLDHPHVLPVYEAGEDGGLCYLVTPYCRGPSLAQWLSEQQSPVDVRAAAALVAALAEGLDQAHQLRVLHRDIKPANVLLDLSATEHPAEGHRLVERPLSSFVPKLTDFGLAKLLEVADHETRTGAHLGTPAYMAPEAAAGAKAAGAAADIYALGAILYELLVGKPPLVGESDGDTLRLALTTEPVPPRQLRPKLPRDLEAVVLKCLEKAPADRYATAGELAADLRRFLAGESTLVRPAGIARRGWKAIRKYPAVAALILLAGVLAFALGTGGKWYSERLASERRARNEQQYVRNIKFALDYRRDGAIDQAQALLKEYESPSDPTDDPRNFEWYWLNNALHDQALVVPTPHGEIYGVTYSPDGSSVYSGGQDGSIRIWDSRTGAALGELKGHTSCVNQLGFTADGSRLVSASCDKTVRLWDVAAGRETGMRLEHPSEVPALAIAQHHPWIATGSHDGNVRIWDINTGELLEMLNLTQPPCVVDGVEFSPDDKYVAATSGGAGATVWSTESWSMIRRVDYGGLSLAFFGPDRIILGNGGDKVINGWDFTSTDELRMLHRFPTKVYCLRGAHEHPFYVAGGGALHVLTHNGQLGRVLASGSKRVQGLSLSPHDRRLVAGCFDGNLRFWNLASNEPTLPIGSHVIHGLCKSDGSPWVVVSNHLYGMLVFDARTGEIVTDLPGIHGLLLSASGQHLIVRDPKAGVVSLRRMPAAETVGTICPSSSAHNFTFSLDESTVAIVTADGSATVYDVPSCSARCHVQFDFGESKRSAEVFLSEDGSIVACGPQQAFDTRTGKPVGELTDLSFFGGSVHGPNATTYSPDGEMTATMEDMNGVMVLSVRDSRTRRVLHTVHHPNAMAGWQCWSPDGSRIAVLTGNHVPVLVDPHSGVQVAELDHCSAVIVTLNFTTDGQALRALTRTETNRLEWFEWPAPRNTPTAANGAR
jgi:WD40 repeat protein